jgi:hypothetical protein
LRCHTSAYLYFNAVSDYLTAISYRFRLLPEQESINQSINQSVGHEAKVQVPDERPLFPVHPLEEKIRTACLLQTFRGFFFKWCISFVAELLIKSASWEKLQKNTCHVSKNTTLRCNFS